MSAKLNIQALLNQGNLWHAKGKNSSGYVAKREVLSSGYAALDAQLHCGGWPRGGLSELLLSENGIGELRLLMPLLSKLNQQAGYIVWVNPPFVPYPPALAAQGIDLKKMLLLQSGSLAEKIWAAQQAMASRACAAVLLWLPAKPLMSEIRKLSLAAKKGNCWGLLLRPLALQAQSSAALLRISLQKTLEQTSIPQQKHQLQLTLIKQPGGHANQQFRLNIFPEQVKWTSTNAADWPTFSPITTDSQVKIPHLPKPTLPLIHTSISQNMLGLDNLKSSPPKAFH